MNKKWKLLEQEREEFFDGVGQPIEEKFEVDSFQKEAIDNLVEGHDTLVVAPTGAGKTYIAIEAIKAYLAMQAKSIYTTPLKALSNTKYTELGKLFEGMASVGLLTGDRKIEGDSDVVVATTEIFRNELYHRSDRYGLVVLDEVHFIADPQRGAVWEESIILAPSSSTLLMLSASISNPFEIAEWLQQVRGKECKVVIKKKRPVELRFGFIHPRSGIVPLYVSGHDGSEGSIQVHPEVTGYYGAGSLDSDGLKIKGGRFNQNRKYRGKSNSRQGGSRDGGRGSSNRGGSNKGGRGSSGQGRKK